MESVISYQTSYLKDKYIIFSNNFEVGNVFKTEWLGAIVEGNINGRKIKLVDKGFINPTITIVDKKTNQVIGSVIISNLLTFYPLAALTTENNHKFKRTTQRILDNSWQWIDLATGQTRIKSSEPLNIFRQTGAINIIEKTNRDDLLIAVGIHIRNVIHRKAHLARLIGLVALLILASIRFL
jgi:hypothetical protein